MRLHPSVPGTIEVEVRPDVHRVDGVWMLDFDEDGSLSRLRQDDIELQWETDDAFYRAERRLEDIQALMADGGKSAVQLIVEVFLARPDQGLTVDEIWGLVAISRLFAKATIAQTLSSQTGLFESRNGRWYKIGDQLRIARAGGTSKSTTGSSGTRTPKPGTEALRLARKLAQLLVDADDGTLQKVVQLLGIRDLLQDRDFADACQKYVRSSDPGLFEAIIRDVRREPGLALVAAHSLEGLSPTELRGCVPLLEFLTEEGGAAAAGLASGLLGRLVAITDAVDAIDDPIKRAEYLTEDLLDGDVTNGQMAAALEVMWSSRRSEDPFLAPVQWLDDLVRMEVAHRTAARCGTAMEAVDGVRRQELGWLNAQLSATVYKDPDQQRLRVVLDLLLAADARTVLDGLHQLSLLAEKTPGGEGDAHLMSRLIVAHAALCRETSALVERHQARSRAASSAVPSDVTVDFARRWCQLANLSEDAVLVVR
jgi:hypothetical protein